RVLRYHHAGVRHDDDRSAGHGREAARVALGPESIASVQDLLAAELVDVPSTDEILLHDETLHACLLAKTLGRRPPTRRRRPHHAPCRKGSRRGLRRMTSGHSLECMLAMITG